MENHACFGGLVIASLGFPLLLVATQNTIANVALSEHP